MEGLLTNNLLSKSDIFNKSGGSNIKSQQRITYSLLNGSASANVSITPVEWGASLVDVSIIGNSGGADDLAVRAKLQLDGDSVDLLRGASGADLEIELVVTEYNNVKSKQVIDYNGTSISGNPWSTNQTITTINASKAKVIESHYTDNGNNDIDAIYVNSILTDSNLQTKMYPNGWTYNFSTQILEFE